MMEELEKAEVGEQEKAEVVEQEKRWCRFCKYFLDGGTVFAEEFLPNDHITHEAAEPICERYRQMVSFYPYTCQFARDNEDLCGAAGRGYIECEDRYDALDDNLKGIESVKNGHGPYIIRHAHTSQPTETEKKGFWKRVWEALTASPVDPVIEAAKRKK